MRQFIFFCRTVFLGPLLLFLVTLGYCEPEPSQSASAKLAGVVESLGFKKVIQQVQYEVDLKNEILWIRTCEFLGNDYVMTRTRLPKEAILDFVEGKTIEIPPPQLGYAKIDGKNFRINLSTQTWMPAGTQPPYLEIGVFDYLTKGSSSSFQDAINMAEIELESAGLNELDEIKKRLSDLKNPACEKVSFNREPFSIQVTSLPGGFIKEWLVSRDGVPLRKIENRVLEKSTLMIDAKDGNDKTSEPKLCAPNDLVAEIFKSQGNTPSLGAFLVPDVDGKYVVKFVLENGPADKAGMRPGDQILKINGTEIKGCSFSTVRQLLDAADFVKVVSQRQDGSRFEKRVKKEVLFP